MLINDSNILVEAENRPGQQERLRHVVEQTTRHVVYFNHLISHQRDTAHDEQHRTGVLRDLEASVVFHGLHHAASCSSEDKSDDVTDCLEDCLNCLVHKCCFLMMNYMGFNTLQRYVI